MPELNKKTLRNVFLVIAGAIILYWLLHETERVKTAWDFINGILTPFIVGSVMAFILNVPMRGFERLYGNVKKPMLRRVLAVLTTLVIVIGIIAAVICLLIPRLIDTVEQMIPKFAEFFTEIGAKFNQYLEDNPDIEKWITENTDLEGLDWANLAQKAVTIVGNSVSAILKTAFSAIGGVFSAVFNGFIAIVFCLYCLFQKETLARQGRKLLYAYLKEPTADEIVRVMRISNSTFSNFLSGQCIEVCILGAMFAVSMLIFRMPYVAIVSLLVAVTAFIPIVGAWLGCALGAFFILVENPMTAVWFIVLFIVLQQIENNLIYPRVVGSSIGLPGMWVLVAVAFGGELMGVAGMFLMIPIASVIYTLIKEYANRRLALRNIPEEKLTPQPPDVQPRFKFRKKKKAPSEPKK